MLDSRTLRINEPEDARRQNLKFARVVQRLKCFRGRHASVRRRYDLSLLVQAVFVYSSEIWVCAQLVRMGYYVDRSLVKSQVIFDDVASRQGKYLPLWGLLRKERSIEFAEVKHTPCPPDA